MTVAATTCPVTGLRVGVRRRSRGGPQPSRCVASIEISISNPHCEGVYLQCQLNWAMRKGFGDFEFSIGDTLRIYNYATIGHPQYGRLDLSAATKVAIEEGNVWIEKETPLIRACLKERHCRMMRWEAWKADPRFQSTFDNLLCLYTTSSQFRACVQEDVVAYAKRKAPSYSFPSEDERSLLARYILEEMSVYQIQAESRPTVNIYAGAELQVFRQMSGLSGIPQSLRDRHYVYLEIREPAKETKR